MKRTLISAVLLMTIALFLWGCATLVHGSSQRIRIASSPTGAKVSVDTVSMGITPLFADLKRGDEHIVRIELGGYQKAESTITRSFSGWVLGNILFPIGLVVDAATGGIYDLSPERLTVRLKKEGISSIEQDTVVYASVQDTIPAGSPEPPEEISAATRQVSVGWLLPLADFASQDPLNPQAGFAGQGFALGYDRDWLWNNTVGLLFSGLLMANEIKEEEMARRIPGVSLEPKSYTMLGLFVGPRVSVESSIGRITIAAAQVGIVFESHPSVRSRYPSSSGGFSYGGITAKFPSLTFGYVLSSGVTLGRICVRLRYVRTQIGRLGDLSDYVERGSSQSASFILLTAGLQL